MMTFMLVFIVGPLLLFIPVWSGYSKHAASHRIDLMAGDEGDD